MRPVLSALVLLLALPLSVPLHAQDKTSAAKDLHTLFDAEWERGLRENPVSATYIGDHRFDDKWPDLSPAALQASYEGDRAVIAALDKIGELKIKQLRGEAPYQLGDKFDIRAFHDVVLGSGAIPLDVLEANVHRWVDATKAAHP